MSAIVAKHVTILLLLLLPAINTEETADNLCVIEENTYVSKNTLASSDSYRDNANTMLILPDAEAQYAPHFIQDKCARQSKLGLPYSCFAIHSPQTWQHEQGYLSVKSLENEHSKKWKAVINKRSAYSYDAFFDYNLGLWVLNLHKYLKQLNDYNDILTDYIGLKWYSPKPIDKTFYSLIIHSPQSQIVFELISFNKPDLSLYPNLRKDFQFMQVNEIRVSFMAYKHDQYPWNREDNADIIPVKISYGCADVDEMVDFYTNIMEATLLYKEDIISTMDNVPISYAFVASIGDVMEFEFVQRPSYYTFGKFTTESWAKLMMQTHYDIITSPTCGLDRWFDNHYGFNTLKLGEDVVENYNYMDRVLSKLLAMKGKYRLYYTPYQFESPVGKYWVDKYDKSGLYTLFVFDPNGQTIQMLGIFFEYVFPFEVPMYNKQWCWVPCLDGQQMGYLDPIKIYREDEDDDRFGVIGKNVSVVTDDNTFIYFGICIVLLMMIIGSICQYVRKEDIDKDEKQHLLTTPPRYYI